MSKDKTYKIVVPDLKGGSRPEKGVSFDVALRNAEKNAINDFEALLNKNCAENTVWRFHSFQKIPFSWNGIEYSKEVIVLYNSDFF